MKNLIAGAWRVARTKPFQIVFFGFLSAYFLNLFFLTYSLQFPVVVSVRSPLVRKQYYKEVIKIKTVIVTPTPTPKPKTDMEIIDSLKQSAVLRKVYFLESTSGRFDGCKDKGQFNGFGYGQNESSWNCFSSFEEVAKKVDGWFTEKFAKGFTENEALCLYNTGTKQPMCNYSIKASTL